MLAGAAALRLYRLGYFSYWLDEILETYWMSGDWPFFWRSIRFDAGHPPLDYLLVRCWEALSPSDPVRKFPVVLWGVGAVACFGLLIARRVRPSAGLLAGALLALAPFHVHFSQELRPYSLGLFLLCFSLLLLDRYLDRPGTGRLLLLFGAFVAAVYTSYLLQIVLGLAAGALLVEDALSPDPVRRIRARQSLRWSPAFAALIVLAYLPWLPVQLEAARRASVPAHVEPFGFHRVGRLLSFFLFTPDGGRPPGATGAVYLGVVVIGALVSLRRPGTRFLLAWFLGGFAVVETLLRIHPHWDVPRLYLPAGISLLGLAATGLDALRGRRGGAWAAAVLLAFIVLFDARALSDEFRSGRPDWRPLAAALRSKPATERIFTENQYSQLCVAFYVDGPQWLYRGGREGRDIWNLDGDIRRLSWSWKPGAVAWLVLAGVPESPELRERFAQFPGSDYSRAEGSARLVQLDPKLRDQALFLHR